MTSAADAQRSGRELVRSRRDNTITSVAWRPEAVLDLAGWIHQGKRLGSIGRGAAWWIGDWVNYGNERFGEKYSRAALVTGYDVQTLMNMAYVAGRFDISRRRENLSWSHHAEVAALPPAEQDRWLEVASARRMSVGRLRTALRTQRTHAASAELVTAPAVEVAATAGEPCDGDPVACPRCGYRWSAGPPVDTGEADTAWC